MVQDDKAYNNSCAIRSVDSRDPSARKAGFEAVQRAEAEKKRLQQQKEQQQQQQGKYGAWGPVFKDRQTFNSMHFC